MDPAATGPFRKLDPGAPGDPVPFGNYLLLGLIARGGMAEVYRARTRGGAAGRMLAIKVMRPQLAAEARFVEMFIREGRLAMLLRTDAIVHAVDMGEVDGRYFIAMEYIAGKDLTQVLRRCQETNQCIPVPHAIHIAARICDGLDFAHTLEDAQGHPLDIVNRDVSPSNVRLGWDGRVKLLDFGIAQPPSDVGVLKGKFSYMSPEQIAGLPVDARSDVFSAGIILHEMLTTEKLFPGDTELAVMEKLQSAEITPPSRFNRRVDAELDRIVMKALARDVADRYQSARRLRDELLTLLEGFRFQPHDLREFVCGLFRHDHAREMEELRACEPDGGSASIPPDSQPERCARDVPQVVTAVTTVGSGGPAPEPASSLPPEASSSEKAPVPAASAPPPPAKAGPLPPPEATAPSPGGLWSRLRNKLSR